MKKHKNKSLINVLVKQNIYEMGGVNKEMKYELSAQEKSYFCVPACLQAVLRRYGEEISQEQIAIELSLDEEGASVEKIENLLGKRNLNFKFFNYNATPFNEPDFLLKESLTRGKDVLIAEPNKKGFHVLLLEDFKDPVLIVRDPKDAETCKIDIYSLMQDMFKNRVGGFGLVEKL